MPPSAQPSTSTSAVTLVNGGVSHSPDMTSDETSPLLRKPAASVRSGNGGGGGVEEEVGDVKEVEVYVPGQSSFFQTLINTLGDLIGTGLLAAPIAIAHSGWILGPLFLFAVGAVTLWTMKILLRIIEKDRRLRSYTDVLGFGVGPTAHKWVTIMFVIEVAIWEIALVVLFSDSLEAVLPIMTSDQWKLASLIVVLPTSFVPLRWLSGTSALGVASTWMLIGILIFTGIATPEAPGSLRHPGPTDILPAHGLVKLGTTFGLLIAGFGGHVLVPSLVRDMKHPEQADRVVELAYAIAMAVYFLVAVCGYLMYGRDVSDQVSRDLARTPGFSVALQKFAVWTVALSTVTKIPLGLKPLADIIFTHFHLHPSILLTDNDVPPSSPATPTPSSPSPSDSSNADAIDPSSPLNAAHSRRERLKTVFRFFINSLLPVLTILGALLLPNFEAAMSFLGNALCVTSMIVFPIWAGAGVFGWSWPMRVVFWVSVLVGAVGTVCTFFSG